MRLAVVAGFVLIVAGVGHVHTGSVSAQSSCAQLASLSLPNTTITSVTTVPAGQWERVPGARLERVPEFCRVQATLMPSPDSGIRIEVWLPTSNWNGRFQAAGTDGGINYASATDAVQTPGSVEPASGMLRALRRGFATGSNDNGETLADEAYRSVHEMTVKAKAIIRAFYGKAPAYSYFNGCSHGGGQGAMEAHRFPDDYDGIIIGCAGSGWSHGFSVRGLWLVSELIRNPEGAIPRALEPVIQDAVMRACDAIDGLTDGLIDDPRRCKFDPGVLLCKTPEASQCLTSAQVATVRRELSPITNPRTGALIYPPREPGTPLGRSVPSQARVAAGQALSVGFFKLALNDPAWDWRTFDLDRDVAVIDRFITANQTNALNPDVLAFAKGGGKMIIWQGWADGTNVPQSSINYYAGIRNLLGERAASNAVRLFMAPGMGHCGYGYGPNTFDGIGVLMNWVEKGVAPDRIDASYVARENYGKEVSPSRTRPLCPYPQVARYTGTGSIDDAANFTCKAP